MIVLWFVTPYYIIEPIMQKYVFILIRTVLCNKNMALVNKKKRLPLHMRQSFFKCYVF